MRKGQSKGCGKPEFAESTSQFLSPPPFFLSPQIVLVLVLNEMVLVLVLEHARGETGSFFRATSTGTITITSTSTSTGTGTGTGTGTRKGKTFSSGKAPSRVAGSQSSPEAPCDSPSRPPPPSIFRPKSCSCSMKWCSCSCSNTQREKTVAFSSTSTSTGTGTGNDWRCRVQELNCQRLQWQLRFWGELLARFNPNRGPKRKTQRIPRSFFQYGN